MSRFSIILLTLITISHSISAQPTTTSEQALQNFKSGNYAQAALQFGQLFTQLPRDARYNYYYGASLVETNNDLSQAGKCLRYAVLKNFNKEAFYYLGRACQLNYEFGEALIQFNKFIALPGIDGNMKTKALQYIEECKTGNTMVAKIYSPVVMRSDTVERDAELVKYNLSSDAGKLLRNNDFFESGIDPNGTVFTTERGDVVFFTMPNNDHSDLYKMERLIDGWSEAFLLKGDVNSASDERYPFLSTDGITLYFSSNRSGGFGGYDIYKSTYDSQTKQFGSIVNMGIPFNSPCDDYFFAVDEFKNTAWFSSNRSTKSSLSVVYTIQWDDKLIKNNATDINEVKQIASMPLSPLGMTIATKNENTGDGVSSKYANALFRFQIADTLEYTQYNHFRSVYALEAFKKGFQQEKLRDSLSFQMSEKRRLYAKATTETERNQHVNDILQLEKETYGIGDVIENNYFEARKYEQDKIRELIRLGKYSTNEESRIEASPVRGIQQMNIPTNLTIYTDDDFGRELKALQNVYSKFFHADDAARLLQADSMYVWGNVLNIESSRLLEKAYKPVEPEVKIPRPFQNNQPQEAQPDAGQQMVNEAKELRENALNLYHLAFDTKYQIYNTKYSGLKLFSLTSTESSRASNYAAEATSFYITAQEMIGGNVGGVDLETYEKSGSLKRKAVAAQEKGLFYLMQVLENRPLAETTLTDEEAPAQTVVENADSVVMPPIDEPMVQTQIQASESTNAENPEYRIQIGVFRNQPDAAQLKNLPSISTEKVDDSGLTRYFTGSYSTYNQASTHLATVKANGFPSAFIVAYLNNKQITVIKARELEPKY